MAGQAWPRIHVSPALASSRPRSNSCSHYAFTSSLSPSPGSSPKNARRGSIDWALSTRSPIRLDSPYAPPIKADKTSVENSKAAGDSSLVEWKDLSFWQQRGSVYIQTGYRQASNSMVDCCKSWTYLHNETVNIYSHILGAFTFALLPAYVFTTEIPPRYEIATAADLTVFFLYFSGVSICFMLSATFHTVMNHSPWVYHIGAQLDFQGILILMWSATVAIIYYGFYCDPTLQRIYWALHSTSGVACSILTFRPRFQDPHLLHLRALTFGSFGLSTVVPVIHATARYGWAIQAHRMGLMWICVTLFFNTFGALAYTLRLPEKRWSRTFDTFGASHQILHVAVVIAGLAFTLALLQAFDFLHEFGDTCAAKLKYSLG